MQLSFWPLHTAQARSVGKVPRISTLRRQPHESVKIPQREGTDGSAATRLQVRLPASSKANSTSTRSLSLSLSLSVPTIRLGSRVAAFRLHTSPTHAHPHWLARARIQTEPCVSLPSCIITAHIRRAPSITFFLHTFARSDGCFDVFLRPCCKRTKFPFFFNASLPQRHHSWNHDQGHQTQRLAASAAQRHARPRNCTDRGSQRRRPRFLTVLLRRQRTGIDTRPKVQALHAQPLGASEAHRPPPFKKVVRHSPLLRR